MTHALTHHTRAQIVHDDAHLRNIVRKTLIARLGGVTFVDKECKDLYFSPGTLHAARYAAGGAVAAVQALFEGTTAVRSPLQASFAIVRPPGHHCSSSTPSGFCFLSNTAIAAQYARRILGLSRVAIVDTGEGVTIIAALLLVHELTHMQTIIQACGIVVHSKSASKRSGRRWDATDLLRGPQRAYHLLSRGRARSRTVRHRRCRCRRHGHACCVAVQRQQGRRM